MKKRELTIAHHGRDVHGYFYEPDTKEYPLIIMSHGYNGHKSDFDISAEYFANNGIGAVCYTFCGGSVRDESGFHTTEMTLFTEEEDLCAVLDEVLTWDQVKKEEIFLFGGSQGGLISAMAAADRKDDVKGLILLYPAFCIADNWNSRFKSEDDIPSKLELWGMELGNKFFRTLRGFDLHTYISRFEQPVLIMHGDRDEVVPLSYSESAAEEYEEAKLEVFAGEIHGFTDNGNRQMEAMTMYFIHDLIGKE